jgi:hypothetical protein
MAFLIYKKTTIGDLLRFERVKSLKLSGADGLIARHVKSLPGEAAASWKLSTTGLLQLAGVPPGATDQTVLFDLGGGATSVCLYELTGIHGSSRDTATQLALDFTVVIDREIDGDPAGFARKFGTPIPAKAKLLGETLALTGGPCGGDWKWGETAMNLGVTVVQAQAQAAPHHNGGGEPCPNCTCGRRTAAVQK